MDFWTEFWSSFWMIYFIAITVTLVAWVANNRRLLDLQEFMAVAIISTIPVLNVLVAFVQCVLLIGEELLAYDAKKKDKK